jgi:hypothetical protein
VTAISGGVLPVKFDSNNNVLANINAQNINPNVNQPPIWSYNRPAYQKNEFAGLNQSATTANTVYSIGQGVSIISVTGFILVKTLLGAYKLSSSGTYTVYVYRSTVGIPAAGAAPSGSDVQILSYTGTSDTSSAPNNIVLDLVDTVSQGTTVYYYIAVSSSTASNTITIVSLGVTPTIGVKGVINTPSIEALCV